MVSPNTTARICTAITPIGAEPAGRSYRAA
jgi:hypothetical protein